LTVSVGSPSVVDTVNNNSVIAKMELEIEPGFIHLG
jgi:hypothetical protein